MKIVLIAAALAASIGMSARSQVAGQCTDSLTAIMYHQKVWGEQAIDSATRPAKVGEGTVKYTLWANPKTSAWHMSGTLSGVTCLLRSGDDYLGVTLAGLLGELT